MSGNSLIFLCRPVGRVHGVVGKVHTLFAARLAHRKAQFRALKARFRKALTRVTEGWSPKSTHAGRQSPHPPRRVIVLHIGAGRDVCSPGWRPAILVQEQRSLLPAALLPLMARADGCCRSSADPFGDYIGGC
jgi:hypothetical protein